MSTTTAKGSGSTVNDGGTINLAGNKKSDSRITDTMEYGRISYRSGVHGAIVPGPDSDADIAKGHGSQITASTVMLNDGTFQPYTSGTFAHTMGDREFLVYNLTATISGVAQSYGELLSGCTGGNVRSIHRRESTVTLLQSSWNWITGVAATNRVETNFAGVGGGSSQDHAARPTSAIPGELVYHETGQTATQDDYPAVYLF